MSNKVSEILARPTRTAAQATPAWVIVELIDSFMYDLDERQFSVLVLALTLLVGAVTVAVENHTGKAFLRRMPPTEVPVIEDAPEVAADHDDRTPADPGYEPRHRA